MKPFELEFVGKMYFYLSIVDDRMRLEHNAPTHGLLLRCTDAINRVKVENALPDVKKPIGVPQWRTTQTQLVDSLPKKLRGSLPTLVDIERELNKPHRTNAGRISKQ